MIKFFKHFKFWGPLVIVGFLFIVAELVLRAGLWDNKIKPLSYLGHGVYRAKTMQAYGLEKFNWVAVGNSVLDWGLDHRRIRSELSTKNIEYGRMTMGSSKFPAVQMIADWSVENMQHLDGLIVGSSAAALGSYHLATQYKISWPFINAYDPGKYQYDVSGSPLKNYYQKLALFVYFDDIKDYFVTKKRRSGKVNKNYAEPERILNFNLNKAGQVCGYELSTLKACVATANKLRKKIEPTKFEREIINRCPAKLKNRHRRLNSMSAELDEQTIALYAQNWSSFILDLADQSKQVKFLVLPEHPIIQYTTKPIGMDEVLDRVIQSISSSEWVEVHDLRELFSQHETHQTCELFNDGIHLNNLGKSVLTEYVLSMFESSKALNF